MERTSVSTRLHTQLHLHPTRLQLGVPFSTNHRTPQTHFHCAASHFIEANRPTYTY